MPPESVTAFWAAFSASTPASITTTTPSSRSADGPAVADGELADLVLAGTKRATALPGARRGPRGPSRPRWRRRLRGDDRRPGAPRRSGAPPRSAWGGLDSASTRLSPGTRARVSAPAMHWARMAIAATPPAHQPPRRKASKCNDGIETWFERFELETGRFRPSRSRTLGTGARTLDGVAAGPAGRAARRGPGVQGLALGGEDVFGARGWAS